LLEGVRVERSPDNSIFPYIAGKEFVLRMISVLTTDNIPLYSWKGSVLSVGLVCTFYSTLGGMKAVLMTDLFQVFFSKPKFIP
jgi:Na+/proline symporter